MDQKGTSVDAPPPYSAVGGQPMPGVPPQQGYYDPQAGQAGMPAQVTVVTVAPQFGPHPMNVTCPQCRANIVTATRTEPGLLTWLICGACVLFGCWLGCCLVPFCIPECQDVAHTCPNCKHFLGTSRRL